MITEISGFAGGVPRGQNHGALAALQIHTSTGRTSDLWGGRHGTSSSFSIKAPATQHIVSFWGLSTGKHAGWDGIVDKLGVYFGQGTITPQQQQCTKTMVYGYWQWLQMINSAETITSSAGVTNADGTGGSTETMKTLANSEGESFTVGESEPVEFGGWSWSSTTSWSTSQTESTAVSSSWSSLKTTSYTKTCSRAFTDADGGQVYQWVWAYYCNTPANLSFPIGKSMDACGTIILLPFTCPAWGDERCAPLYAPFNCKDAYCQTGYAGATNLKTGEVVSAEEGQDDETWSVV